MPAPPKDEIPAPSSDRRKQRRRHLIAAGKIVQLNQDVHNCTILDISEGGARVSCRHAVSADHSFFLLDLARQKAHEVRVASVLGQEYGLRFFASYSLGQLPAELQHLKRLWFENAR